jgi:hypothetical protein
MTIKDVKIDALSNFVLHLALTIQIVLQLALTILSKNVDFFGYIPINFLTLHNPN